MKLAEALTIINAAPADAGNFPVLLACGFTPLHLQNYLLAHLQKSVPNRKVRLVTGLYGDINGALEQLGRTDLQTGALALEWSDLDPRLGYRQLGGWGPRVLPAILESVNAALERLHGAIRELPAASRVAVSLPTLPLPPAFHTVGWQASEAELALNEALARFARGIGAYPHVFLVNQQHLDSVSPPHARYDFKSDLHTGFPYTLTHADALGNALASLISSAPPKKGLITDLDDTLWSGLVGEVGHESVSWDLDNRSQLHGLYQQMLHALADQGVLIGIASKNSPQETEKALARTDLAIARDKIFPVEVHWHAKSGSVARILEAWNIGADSVVFVDDSPMELEEVRNAHPGIECLLFPKSDYAAALDLLRRLRDLFGKPALLDEDRYRLDSLRQNRHFVHANGNAASQEDFLAGAESRLMVEYNPRPADRRVVELVNKTNQFNLNGIRYTEPEWQAALGRPGSFAMAVSYEDRFGPLGNVGVLRGLLDAPVLRLETWVMSCRAFSRRIEHQCLAQLFQKFGIREVVFAFQPTPKNGPIQDFLSALLDESPGPMSTVSRASFEAKCPKLYHQIVETNG